MKYSIYLSLPLSLSPLISIQIESMPSRSVMFFMKESKQNTLRRLRLIEYPHTHKIIIKIMSRRLLTRRLNPKRFTNDDDDEVDKKPNSNRSRSRILISSKCSRRLLVRSLRLLLVVLLLILIVVVVGVGGGGVFFSNNEIFDQAIFFPYHDGSFSLSTEIRIIVDFATNDNNNNNVYNNNTVILDLPIINNKNENKNTYYSLSTLGPHNVKVQVNPSCTIRGVWIRIEGDALVAINLIEKKQTMTTTTEWNGSFTLPIEGNYELTLYWYGCENKHQQSQKQEQSILQRIQVMKQIKVTTSSNNLSSKNNYNNNNNKSGSSSNSIFPDSAAWISSNKFQQQQQQSSSSSSSSSYIWHNPKIEPSSATLLKVNNNNNNDIILSKDGVDGGNNNNNFYDEFKKLSNYELVCWIGTNSAKQLWESFLKIRPMIANRQRPFKFHYYPMKYINKPDHDWELETKKRFRKCKHVLVSLDDEVQMLLLDDDNNNNNNNNSSTTTTTTTTKQYTKTTTSSLLLSSQRVYATQMTTFINHLLKVFPDETFPIWVFTIYNESPMMMIKPTTTTTTTNCINDQFLSKESNYHPCNTVLKYLFGKQQQQKGGDESNLLFPKRVHLLDSTMVSSSLLLLFDNNNDYDYDLNRQHVTAVIALNIFVFIGKQVEEWRGHGQEGTSRGLIRGGKLEPNFELVPYTGWS